MKQEVFAVEQFMDAYETGITYNMGETCCDSLTLNDIVDLYEESQRPIIKHQLQQELFGTKLTYGDITGSDELKTRIANVYNDTDAQVSRDNDTVDITKEDVVISNGAIGANFLTFYSLVCPGDKVIAIDPCYQQLSSVPNLFSNGNLIKFPLQDHDNYQPDVQMLAKLVQQHEPKLVVINNPHNPTGVVWSTETLQQIVDICKPKGSYILCDEVYRPLFHSTTEIPKSIVNMGYQRTISTGSMSKAFSMAGVRLGWAITRDVLLRKDMLSKRDYNTISVSMIDDKLSQLALAHYKSIVTRNYQICSSNLIQLQLFVEKSNGIISWIKPLGGSTCLLKINVDDFDTMSMCQDLAEKHQTLIVPGEVFDRRGYIRIGFGNSVHALRGGLQVLAQHLNISFP